MFNNDAFGLVGHKAFLAKVSQVLHLWGTPPPRVCPTPRPLSRKSYILLPSPPLLSAYTHGTPAPPLPPRRDAPERPAAARPPSSAGSLFPFSRPPSPPFLNEL